MSLINANLPPSFSEFYFLTHPIPIFRRDTSYINTTRNLHRILTQPLLAFLGLHKKILCHLPTLLPNVDT